MAVYTLGLLSQSGGFKAEDSLIKIADAGGGRAYFPNNVDEAKMVMERIARDLREQYTLAYVPADTDRGGNWRSVRIEITPPPGFPSRLKVNYRRGYYGPQ